MFKRKKIKLYIHSSLHLGLQKKTKQAWNLGAGFAMLPGRLLRAIYKVCYHVGYALVVSFSGGVRFVAREIITTGDSLKKRLVILKKPEFAKTLIIFFGIALLGASIFQGLGMATKAVELKNRIIDSVFQGSQNLDQAKQSLENQDLEAASGKFLQAYNSFKNGQKEMENAGALLTGLLAVFPQKQDAENALEAAKLVSESGNQIIDFYKAFDGLKITAQGLQSNLPAGEALENLDSILLRASTNLKNAKLKILEVNADNLPSVQKQSFLEARDKILALENAMGNFREIFSLVKTIATGNKKVLILFQNNNELRATGGFLGTFGDMQLDNGKITKLHISSIYDLDGQLKEKILPPTPILNVNDRWFLRDSNWFAHFPDSAKKITSFYEKEGGETPDIILVLTPNFTIDLLKIIGPVDLPAHGVSLNADNFVELTQAVSSQSDSSPENKPKQILADLVPVLLQKLNELESDQWPAVLESLQQNFNSKQIVLYSRESDLQNKLAEFNWTGEILSTDRDYLSVVSSNLGGTKTDLDIKQEINLKSTIEDDGSVINELVIKRRNPLPKLDYTFNNSFIRIFVREGSQLLENTGFGLKNLDNSNKEDYETDPDVYEWERNAVREVISGTTIGREAGKTFFGNWVRPQGGRARPIKLVHK